MELETPQSRHNTAAIVGRKLTWEGEAMFERSPLEGGPPFAISAGFLRVSEGLRPSKARSVRRVSFPPTWSRIYCGIAMNIVRNNTNEVDSSMQPIAGFIKHLNGNLFRDADVKISEMDWNVGQSIQSIWESCDLSASEFADEVAAYYRRPRMTLPELLASPSLVERFTRRFLRETMIFPYDVGGGRFGLAVADPTDVAAQRGAEIVLGGPVAVSIASFEDIGAALFERLGSDEDGPSASSPVLASGAVEESVDSLRDLASGAPVVRAVNDLAGKSS